jgi:hypothetical protein
MREGKAIVKSALVAFAAATLLAGCQSRPMTLEEAQAQCTKKGGLLVVIYTQPITASGPGAEVASPGDCISPSKFDPDSPAPAPPK